MDSYYLPRALYEGGATENQSPTPKQLLAEERLEKLISGVLKALSMFDEAKIQRTDVAKLLVLSRVECALRELVGM